MFALARQSKNRRQKCDRITIGALLWLDNDENRAGFLLIETHGFGEKKCVADAIDKSTHFRLCAGFRPPG
jgi:hypothetical protein